MMSASAMSAQIRAKKKKMEEDESGAVKLSGIPEDATDIDIIKQHEATDDLNENTPKDPSETPSEGELKLAAPDPKLGGEDDEKPKKFAKIKSMMGRMGK